ncbi:pancreatic triacylglycerol lipase-like [Leptopilina boulardi]|uniref:pancreatic triacylglycerol lipase-like n=1 Tax=Leptopilina boulardi TaxID=63433 RepID=UPI0021F5D5F9|nr:pancreatic triacylglycerol lipase-like [Leptopilina boulardi]
MKELIVIILLIPFLQALTIDWLNQINENLYNHTQIVTNYIKHEIEKLARTFVYFDNDKNEKIRTKLSFPNESLQIPKESILNNKTKIDLTTIVSFRLYTLEIWKNYEILQFNNSDSLKKSHFNTKRPTRFITHGYLTSGNGPSCTVIRDAFMKRTNSNVIVVDWSPASQESYLLARLLVPPIGMHVGEMISFLEDNGMNASTTALIGHSLGAHVMGIAGKTAKKRVKYLVGLDPAMPLFRFVEPEERIAIGDADFVEIIHTDAGILGFPENIGDFDFYPNGGMFQPGCENDDLLYTAACSHSRAYMYFAESIENPLHPFFSLNCENYSAFKYNVCSPHVDIMGAMKQSSNHSGSYYLNTNSEPPFSQGKNYGKPKCSKWRIVNFFLNIIRRIRGGYIC